MTIIVGFTKNNKVYIGGDKLASDSYFKEEIKSSKVFKNKHLLIGFTTSFRFGDILEYSFEPPSDRKSYMSDKHYIVDSLIPAIRKTLEHNKYCDSDSTSESGTALIGYNGNLYKLQDDWSIIQNSTNIMAIGSGAEYALGALEVLHKTEKSPKKILSKVIKITSKYSPSVSKANTVLSL